MSSEADANQSPPKSASSLTEMPPSLGRSGRPVTYSEAWEEWGQDRWGGHIPGQSRLLAGDT